VFAIDERGTDWQCAQYFMSIIPSLRSFVVVIGALYGASACTVPEPLASERSEQLIAPPTTVSATAVSDTRISVSWTSVPGAFKYFVERSTSGGPFEFVASVLEPDTSYLSTGLVANTTYAYQIVAVSTDGSESAPSAPPATATTLAEAPGAPTNLVARAISGTQIDLSWSAVATATKYFVFQSQAGGAFGFRATVLSPGTTYSATNLLANTLYCYRLVTSFPDGSESAPTSPACATTSDGPTGVLATAVTDTRIHVQWQPAIGAVKYLVYESQNGPYTVRGSVVNATEFVAVNLMPLTHYCYRVTAVSGAGTESALSASSCDTTLAPGEGAIEGFWKFDEVAGGAALDSSVFDRHGTITNASYELLDLPPINDDRSALSFSSDPSSAVSVPMTGAFTLSNKFSLSLWVKIPVAADVTFLGTRDANCGSIGWEFAQDSVNGLHLSLRTTEIIRSPVSVPVGTWTHIAATFERGPLARGTTRLFVNGVQTVSAVSLPGFGSQPLNFGHVAGCAGGAVLIDDVQIYSENLSSAQIAVLGTVPPAPLNLVVASKTSVSTTLSWDPVPGASRYILSRGTVSGDERFYTHTPADPASYQADHLAPNTQQSWTIRAVVNRLFSVPSNEVIAITDAAPTAPADVVATVIAPDRIQVTWTASARAAKYLVYQSINGGPFVLKGTTVDTTFLAVNLSAATTYAYSVQAEDAVQTRGLQSDAASATTP
jgi:fibronectin type 3 domain-containing protein